MSLNNQIEKLTSLLVDEILCSILSYPLIELAPVRGMKQLGPIGKKEAYITHNGTHFLLRAGTKVHRSKRRRDLVRYARQRGMALQLPPHEAVSG